MKSSFKMTPAQLPAIAAFACVARHGSFTRAADELGISTSALSQTMRRLERTMGVRLLARTTRKVAATAAGTRFLNAVVPGLDSLAGAWAALQDEGDTPRGVVRVCLSRVAFALLVEPHLAGFAQEFPDIELELGLSDGISDIVSEGYDLGIRLDERLAQDMVAVPIGGPQRLAIVGSPAYFRSHAKPKVPADLRAHNCIRLRFVSSSRLFRFWLSRDGEELDIDVRGHLVLNDMVPIVEAARAGVGLAQVFEGLAQEHLEKRRLVRVLEEYSTPFPGFYFYYPSRAHLPLRVRTFVTYFQRVNHPTSA